MSPATLRVQIGKASVALEGEQEASAELAAAQGPDPMGRRERATPTGHPAGAPCLLLPSEAQAPRSRTSETGPYVAIRAFESAMSPGDERLKRGMLGT
jgi:hypothetical protein